LIVGVHEILIIANVIYNVDRSLCEIMIEKCLYTIVQSAITRF